MRALGLIIVFTCLAACGELGRGEADRRVSLFSSSGGEVRLADGSSFGFAITSEKYKQWDRARRGINKKVAARFGAILRPDAPTEASIEEAVAYLESQPSARSAIERAGMSVRGFVTMTVALEQEMRLASGEPATTRPAVDSAYAFPQVDTTMIAPMPVPVPTPTVTPPPIPGDTAIPVDTVFRAPIPRDSVLPPVTRRDTTPTIFRRRDTATARDTLGRQPIPSRDTTRPPATPPVTRDTLRDTTRSPAPPDTLRGASLRG